MEAPPKPAPANSSPQFNAGGNTLASRKSSEEAISPHQALESSPGITITITEIMAMNDGLLPDDDGQFPDWIEIHNAEAQDVSLQVQTLGCSPHQFF